MGVTGTWIRVESWVHGRGAVSYCDPNQAGKSVTFPNDGLRKRGSRARAPRHCKSGDPNREPAGTAPKGSTIAPTESSFRVNLPNRKQ